MSIVLLASQNQVSGRKMRGSQWRIYITKPTNQSVFSFMMSVEFLAKYVFVTYSCKKAGLVIYKLTNVAQHKLVDKTVILTK